VRLVGGSVHAFLDCVHDLISNLRGGVAPTVAFAASEAAVGKAYPPSIDQISGEEFACFFAWFARKNYFLRHAGYVST
jgi:hypothetical protein